MMVNTGQVQLKNNISLNIRKILTLNIKINTMRYYKKSFWFLSICFSFIGTSCSKNIMSGNAGSTSTVDSDCTHSINIFNKYTTGNLIKEIQVVNERGSRIDELKVLYPKARDAWNKGLGQIENSYSSDWSGVTGVQIEEDPFDTVLNQGEEKPKNFFELLTNLRYGSRRVSRHDVLTRAALAEKSDIKRRLDGIVNATLKSDCRNLSTSELRSQLNPMKLPQKFEDCLIVKID